MTFQRFNPKGYQMGREKQIRIYKDYVYLSSNLVKKIASNLTHVEFFFDFEKKYVMMRFMTEDEVKKCRGFVRRIKSYNKKTAAQAISVAIGKVIPCGYYKLFKIKNNGKNYYFEYAEASSHNT